MEGNGTFQWKDGRIFTGHYFNDYKDGFFLNKLMNKIF